jgi:L-2,4-diaminobutyrate transaminase
VSNTISKISTGVLDELDKTAHLHGFSALHSQSKREVQVFESGEGVWLTDNKGRRFLDAAGGLWCANVGYGRDAIAEVAAKQMRKAGFLHSFSTFSHEPVIRLTERLLGLAPRGFSRIFYGNSGSDANDTQIKLVHRYNNVRGTPTKKKIISRMHAYHGSTIAAASLTGISAAHRTFDIPIPGIRHTLAADYYRRPDHITTEEQFTRFLADELERLIQEEGPDTVAAFIAEPIGGAGGLLVPPAGYFREIGKVLKRYDILMIADEVITGFGRTGAWFASPALEIEPDLMTISKGLTSGYWPMSACLLSEKVSRVLYAEETEDGAFGHGFTASGHPVGAAVALANIDILDSEALPENARVIGEYLFGRLREKLGSHELVGDIRGAGLLVGVELDRDKKKREPFRETGKLGSMLVQACFDQRLIVRGARGRVLAAMAPPLVLSRQEADEIVDRLGRAIDNFAIALRKEGLS